MYNNIPQAGGIQILITYWTIWHTRRKAIHEEVFQSPFSTVAIIRRLIQEMEITKGFEFKGRNKHHPSPRTHSWIPPEDGCCKLNTDVAVGRARTRGVVGVVCRNNQGNFIVASAMVVPNRTDLETLEALACLEALALAEYCGIHKMLVASNCLNVVKNIKELPRCSYMMILQDIFQRSKSCQYVRFVHEGREYNREAHYLAKYACTLGEG
jgi:ribonuclease HI